MLKNYLSTRITRFSLLMLIASSIVLLTGCTGSGGDTATTTTTTTTAVVQTLTGTVATGAPLVGATITIKDSLGATVSGTTAADGTFSIAVTGMTPPFMLVASPAVIGQSNMYSILPAMDMTTANTQNVNITPVTTLVMYELNAGADPASMYNAVSFTTVAAANVSAKETIVRSKLPANTVNPVFSMMYGSFAAGVYGAGLNPDPYDSALDGIGAITNIGATVTFATLATPYTPTAGGAVTTGVVPTIAITLADAGTLVATNSITTTAPAIVTATVKDANGAAVANAIVTFTTSDALGAFSGGANTALTDAAGVASVTLTTTNAGGGASTVTANTTVAGSAVSNSLNYAIGASAITLSAITPVPAALSAYGTASISVTVLNNGATYTTPMTVSFSSVCAAAGKATLTASVVTTNGVATASYLDNGCNNPAPGGDVITATLMNGVSGNVTLPVSTPAIGSIQFVSVATTPATTPPIITIKGTGGQNLSETARVTFRVVDGAGNPVGGALVNFSLNTVLGGLTLSSASATSDPATGYVVTNVLSGTFSTAVRVTATTGALSTQSDQLLVTTGIPAQDSVSISASTHNIEGCQIDGVKTTVTARFADHFHNPVPDGTAVYFTSEGGSILPSCTTVGGVCSVEFTSQALRPNNCRVTVLVRATGEETFIDLDSNGFVSGINEMIDANNVATDLGEAYVDYNENGTHDVATEPYIDFDGNLAYTGTTGATFTGGTLTGDGLYNGLLCDSVATPALCGAQKSLDVRGSQVIVLSGSNPVITMPAAITLSSCTTNPLATVSTPQTVTVTVVDVNGNPMPAGTTIDFATSNGTVVSPASYVVPDTIGCRAGYAGCPASASSATFGDLSVTLVSDAVYSAVPGTVPCTNAISGGTFTVTVTTPKGTTTTAFVNITD